MSSDPLRRHRDEVAAVLPTGDPAAIKRIYRHLGEDLEAEFGDDPARTPQLSYDETAAVVAGQLHGVPGLVLDAGCGPRPATAILLGRDGSRVVVALDIGEGIVRLALATAALSGVRLRGVVADVERLPFRDGVFAGAVCDDTIEHLPDDAAGIRELARVVAPGARVVVATPNRRSLEVLASRLADTVRRRRRPQSHYYAASSHLREYTWSELERLVAPAFAVAGRATVERAGSPVRRLAGRLTRRPPLRRLSRMIVLVLRR